MKKVSTEAVQRTKIVDRRRRPVNRHRNSSATVSLTIQCRIVAARITITSEAVMRKSLVLLLVTLVCSLPAFAQGSSENLQPQLEALHAKWFKAFDAGDGTTMDKMEISNLVLIMPTGQIWPKDGPRGQWKGDAGAQRTLSNVAVRQYENTAILTGIVTTKGAKEGNGQDATTVVFVRSAGEWKIMSAQWSPISSEK